MKELRHCQLEDAARAVGRLDGIALASPAPEPAVGRVDRHHASRRCRKTFGTRPVTGVVRLVGRSVTLTRGGPAPSHGC